MLFSGVAWGASAFEVEVIGPDGQAARAPVRFGPSETGGLIAYLRDLGPELVAVVDSTNGMIDGRMMAAGLTVYRADPPVLPPRPLFGSVPAGDLARAAHRGLSRLTRLRPDRGTQTDREDLIDAGIEQSAAATEALMSVGRWLRHGVRGRREVALTFDDGPLPPYTGQVLDVLERYEVPATFFCVGLNAAGFGAELTRMREQGHGLGNHTWSHPFLPELSRPQLLAQIERTGAAIADASGGSAPTLFRPPYGSRSPEVTRWLGELPVTVVLWDAEAVDWAMPGADVIAQRVLEATQPGSVILLHDGGGDRSQTVAALPAIIEGLQARGYRFVLVDELTT
jgi:peptidoglycan/xylan/chitin deacetylase (PgdA/CDA1 family)